MGFLSSLDIKEKIFVLLAAVIFTGYAIPSAPICSGRVASAQWLLKENGIYENLGALACLAGSIFLGAAYFRFKSGARLAFMKTGRHFYLLFLVLFLFFIFGEEISWGQRLLGFDAPESISRVNFQRELNIHNLKIIQDSNNAVAISTMRLLLAYLILLPLTLSALPSLNRLFSPRGIPVPIIRISFLTPAVYFISVYLARFDAIRRVEHDGIHEAFETLLEIVLLVFSLECYYASKKAFENRRHEETRPPD